MTNDFARTLLNITSSNTLAETASLALEAIMTLFQTEAACLLIWDTGLERYIIGDTWLNTTTDLLAPALRREALKQGQAAYMRKPDQAVWLDTDSHYLPMNYKGVHVAALFCRGLDSVPHTEQFDLLCEATVSALYTVQRIQRADREHSELEAERERLEELLKAVEKQQREIDRLLTIERRFSASLEAQVDKRTRELKLAHNRLVQSEKLAVIGKLASSLAHELNNPLQAIRSGLGLVLDELPRNNGGHMREDLSIILSELERIESIFRQMLDFYRTVQYDNAPLDLNALVNGVRVLMRKRLQEENVILRLELCDMHPQICGDKNQIKQVLLNLLINAMEAMSPLGGDICVITTYNDHHVILQVTDNGPGVKQEQLQHLFEPLFTTKTRGLGLGLSITQEIIQRHGGTISAESEINQGTTFTIKLPIKDECDGENTRS